MARLNVNPNRMELTTLKGRVEITKRGHKLLKDKQDELMRRFITLAKKNNELRKAVEAELGEAYKDFLMVGAVISPIFLEEALLYPTKQVELEVSHRNIMSVTVPQMSFSYSEKGGEGGVFPYSFFGTADELDRVMRRLNVLMPKLLELGEIEKTCNLMADEIEKTRRRVNALEYMIIPQQEETIKYIKMKLDENGRSNTIALMKVKSMMEKKAAEGAV